jgi:Ferritin-like domain
MENSTELGKRSTARRSFLKGGVLASGALVTAGFLGSGASALAQSADEDDRDGNEITDGDVAILRFLAAAELIESDLWTQYAELGGVNNGTLNPFQKALQNLDSDGSQYITSNTLDEVSHAAFLNAYLESKGAEPVDLDAFRTLQGSKATGAQNIGRLTNLMNLNVDTSWYIRYRSTTNPDMGATFPQAVTISNRTAIPRTDADMANATQIQVIANTAAFHFGTIEQGGSSLYASLSRKVTSEQALEITLGIGADEVAHFLEWVDFAGNGVQPPVAPVSFGGLTFPNFNTKGPLFQTNLIFPVPCEFLNAKLPHCAIIRPLTDKFAGARATVTFLTNMNLFAGQPKQFLAELQRLADAADAAKRQG